MNKMNLYFRSFVEKSMVDDMKINGLLTQVKILIQDFPLFPRISV